MMKCLLSNNSLVFLKNELNKNRMKFITLEEFPSFIKVRILHKNKLTLHIIWFGQKKPYVKVTNFKSSLIYIITSYVVKWFSIIFFR